MAEKTMTSAPTPPLCAMKFIRKMRGGSQSSLIEAEDGNFYIVKCMENPQGTQILLNEVMASEIMHLIGLETPMWNPILISTEFLKNNRGLWFELTDSGRRPPPAGLHFGSKMIFPKPTEDLYEILPRNWFPRIHRRDDFIGMLLFDLWAGQRDSRQAIFLADQETRSITVTYIDHGCLFGMGETNKSDRRIRAMYIDPAIYDDVDLEATISKWEHRIETLSESTLRLLIDSVSIPSQWYCPDDINRIISGLAARRAQLGEYAHLITSILNSHRLNTLVEQRDEVPLRGAQLRADGYRRIRHALPGVGSEGANF